MVSFWAGLWHWLYHITFALLYYEHYLAITIYSSLWIFGENSLMKSSLNFHPSKIPSRIPMTLTLHFPGWSVCCTTRTRASASAEVCRPTAARPSRCFCRRTRRCNSPTVTQRGLAHHGRPWEKLTQKKI